MNEGALRPFVPPRLPAGRAWSQLGTEVLRWEWHGETEEAAETLLQCEAEEFSWCFPLGQFAPLWSAVPCWGVYGTRGKAGSQGIQV